MRLGKKKKAEERKNKDIKLSLSVSTCKRCESFCKTSDIDVTRAAPQHGILILLLMREPCCWHSIRAMIFFSLLFFMPLHVDTFLLAKRGSGVADKNATLLH